MVPPLSSPPGRVVEFDRLLRFAQRAVTAGDEPFGYLDEYGRVDERQGHHLWITTRMTHVFALGSMLDRTGSNDLASRGVDALNNVFRDSASGGWFGKLSWHGQVLDDRKTMYDHAFVVLAAATATLAGISGGKELLSESLDVVDHRFWDEEAGACREGWDRVWGATEDYRGANSNMHAVEAFLAAGQVTGDGRWTRRALRIAERLVHHEAASHGWRLPEHYSSSWAIQPDYNRANAADRFRPFGITIGHLVEWARLLIHIESALDSPPAWLPQAAKSMFESAMRLGWQADGSPGLVYTVDWDDRPVVPERMHWVAIEAAMASNVLARRTGELRYSEWEGLLWRDVQRFVDLENGSWHHELDASGAVSSTVWSGKPDVYHAVQGMLLPDLPLTPSLANSLVASRGDSMKGVSPTSMVAEPDCP
jgi:sulfoquinovose isomerase